MILEKYKKIIKGTSEYNNLFSCGKDGNGVMYDFSNTNFRGVTSFIKQFPKFYEIENKPRNEWPKTSRDGKKPQEKHKQHIVNLSEARLIKKVGNHYKKTVKGDLYKKFIEGGNFNSDEKWIINLLFLLDGHYSNMPKYIFNRTRELSSSLKAIIEEEYLYSEIIKLFNMNDKEYFKSEAFIIHSLFSRTELLEDFVNSSKLEKAKFIKYVDHQKEQRIFSDPLSNKIKNGGNLTPRTLHSELAIFIIVDELMKYNYDFNLWVITFIRICSKYFKNINKSKCKEYVFRNADVFNAIHNNIFYEEKDIEIDNEFHSYETEFRGEVNDDLKEIDFSSLRNINEANYRYSNLRKYAKESCNYRCELADFRKCDEASFISKKDNNVYLEVHHLIPREFSNEVGASIEVLANYVALCPNCHRMIHHAKDETRKKYLIRIFEERKVFLERIGIQIDFETFLKYNKING